MSYTISLLMYLDKAKAVGETWLFIMHATTKVKRKLLMRFCLEPSDASNIREWWTETQLKIEDRS